MDKDVIYGFTTGSDGTDYVCPIGSTGRDGQITDDGLNDCVEADVVGRYGGSIQLDRG